MKMYNAIVEVATKQDLTDDQLDDALEQLAEYHGSVGVSARGFAFARVSLPAETLSQAASTAITITQAVLGGTAVAAEVLTEEEFLAREGWAPMPEVVSTNEAADILGVSPTRVRERIRDKSLPATKVGREHVIQRSAVEALKAAARGPGRPRASG